MKKVGIIILVYFFFLPIGQAVAGDYHRSTESSLVCAQCHTMHNSQGRKWLVYDSDHNPNAKLLKSSSVVTLCKFCHGSDPLNIGAPIIFNPPYNASAGEYAPPFSDGSPGIDEYKRHSIGQKIPSAAIPAYPPGMDEANKAAWDYAVHVYDDTFTCEYCHDQHGNANYRNVRPKPKNPGLRETDPADAAKVTYNNGSWDGVSSIAQAIIDGNGKGDDPARQYSTSNMTYRSDKNQIAGFCGKCHVKFYGVDWIVNNGNEVGGFDGRGDCCTNQGNPTQWLRHPVGSIAIQIGNEHTDVSNFNSIPAENRARHIDSAIGQQPFCLTCHRVHGSLNHSNLIFGAPTEIGGAGSMMRDTCQQCHNQ